LRQAVQEFRTYIIHNGHLIPHDGERYRNGEAIATGKMDKVELRAYLKRGLCG
jgi:hypothetical protein